MMWCLARSQKDQLIVGFLGIWLVFFAPLYCEVHGLMLGQKSVMPMHTMAEMDSMEAMADMGGMTPLFGKNWRAHQPASAVTMSMIFITGIVPTHISPEGDTAPRRFELPDPVQPDQPSLPVPKPPPRHS